MTFVITKDNGDLSIPGPSSGQPVTLDLLRLLISGKQEAPDGSGLAVAPLTTIGDENRQRRRDTDQPPLRMICSIEVASATNETPEPIGTGWLVGRRTVVTAGHVLRWRPEGREARAVRVVPGADQARMPYGAFSAQLFHYPMQWRGEAADPPGFDIAAIRLNEPVGERLGWFGASALTDETLRGRFVNISGYPAAVPNRVVQRCTELWWHANHIRKLEPDRIHYDVDTSGGQSGAPVVLWPDPTSAGAAPTVVGVHARGDMHGLDLNSATRINGTTLGLIKEWIDADDRA